MSFYFIKKNVIGALASITLLLLGLSYSPAGRAEADEDSGTDRIKSVEDGLEIYFGKSSVGLNEALREDMSARENDLNKLLNTSSPPLIGRPPQHAVEPPRAIDPNQTGSSENGSSPAAPQTTGETESAPGLSTSATTAQPAKESSAPEALKIAPTAGSGVQVDASLTNGGELTPAASGSTRETSEEAPRAAKQKSLSAEPPKSTIPMDESKFPAKVQEIDLLQHEFGSFMNNVPSMPKNTSGSFQDTGTSLPGHDYLNTGLPVLRTEFGPNSLRHPGARPKKRTTHEFSVGAGPNDTKIVQASSQISIYDHLLGVAYERAQWLDVNTNTGKFTESFYLDYCAPFTFDSPSLSVIPCYRGGSGNGRYKERDAGNEIVEKELKRNVFKVYARGILSLGGGRQKSGNYSVEFTGGFSQDPFLQGGYLQCWLKTPIPFISVGAETYELQRFSLSLGFSHSIGDQ